VDDTLLPVAAAVEDDSVFGLFTSDAYRDWHDGRGLVQK